MASQRTGQAKQTLVIATQAFVVELAVALQEDSLFDALEASFLRVGGQAEEIADKVRNLQFFLIGEDLSKSDDVVEDSIADLAILFLNYAEDVSDFFE